MISFNSPFPNEEINKPTNKIRQTTSETIDHSLALFFLSKIKPNETTNSIVNTIAVRKKNAILILPVPETNESYVLTIKLPRKKPKYAQKRTKTDNHPPIPSNLGLFSSFVIKNCIFVDLNTFCR